VNSTCFAPYVESGKLRLLAVFDAQRSRRWPEVPTMRELGYPDAVYTSPYGIGVPAGVEAAIVRRLHDAFRVAMFEPAHLEALAKFDQQPEYLDTAAYGRYVREVTQRERQLLARLGLAVSSAQ
jgi:tripartite-type tricarboxylate transporter receptor subunit TctC